ncbi:MAG: ABC transporter permease [Chloroflexota bacterium]
MRRTQVGALPLAILGLILLLYLVTPIVALALHLSGGDLWRALQDSQSRDAVLTSLGTASVSTMVIGLLGVPLAYLLARTSLPGRRLLSTLVYLPLVLPPVSAGILLLLLYGPYGTFGQILNKGGIVLLDSAAGIVLAQVFVAAPFVIVIARSAFERIEPEYIEAAASMGAGHWRIFTAIALPMARSGVAAGLALGWMRSLGEFGATVILAYHPYSLPVLNYVDLTGTGLAAALPLALVSVLLALATLTSLTFLGRVQSRLLT